MNEMKDEQDDKGIKISPQYYQKDWNDLDLDKNNIADWNKAIEIFKDRIDGRYFSQIEVLDKHKIRNTGIHSGFAIMSLTCLLIETLEQFWEGRIETSRKSLTGKKLSWFTKWFKKNNDISNDALAFFSFFQRSDALKSFFDTKEKANVFYVKFRCGLLHQGQTKGKSLIHIKKDEPMLKWIGEDNQDISLQRRLFLLEVKEVYKKFINELENGNLNFKKKHLGKKMQYIVDQK